MKPSSHEKTIVNDVADPSVTGAQSYHNTRATGAPVASVVCMVGPTPAQTKLSHNLQNCLKSIGLLIFTRSNFYEHIYLDTRQNTSDVMYLISDDAVFFSVP